MLLSFILGIIFGKDIRGLSSLAVLLPLCAIFISCVSQMHGVDVTISQEIASDASAAIISYTHNKIPDIIINDLLAMIIGAFLRIAKPAT
jgi:hypothetical protein